MKKKKKRMCTVHGAIAACGCVHLCAIIPKFMMLQKNYIYMHNICVLKLINNRAKELWQRTW